MKRKTNRTNWHSLAKKRWPKAEWIQGNGPYALLSWCKVLTVTLWDSLESAEKQKKFIDLTGCGGGCWKKHEIIKLKRKGENGSPD
jgi:hypothetical protein